MFDFIIKNRFRCLQIVEASKMLLPRDDDCHEITESSVARVNHLFSSQEEAGIKVVLHTVDTLQAEDNQEKPRSYNLLSRWFQIRTVSFMTMVLVKIESVFASMNTVF